MRTYIGIDLGTSGAKLLLVSADGSILAENTQGYPVFYPRSGWSEQNPEDWFAAAMRGMKELLRGQDASAVAGISFGGQMHGLVALDKKDAVVRPAILWNDGRTEKQTAYLNEAVGTLKREIAEELGLPQGVRVAAGAGDNAAAAVGTGVVGEGGCNISLGTSGTLFVSSAKYRPDGTNALHSFCHADGGWHLMGCILSAASCNAWWSDRILQTDDYAKEQEVPRELPGRNGVYFLPYLMGERSPHNDVNARGAFIGMRPDTDRKQMTLAVLEGVAFALKDCMEAAAKDGVKPARTKLCGGGARSALWRRIIADVTDMPVDIPQTEQGPAFGAALLAMVCRGEYASVREAAGAVVKVKETVLPDREAAAGYAERYRTFASLYPALKGVFRDMREE